jgi:3-oxoacyl-[acyl-carrier protein] reductase
MFGHMKSQPEQAAGGSTNYKVIMNVIGMAAEHPSFEYLCGATANAGLAAFTKGLGKGSLEHGIRCLGVHPPSTRTDRITSMMKTLAKTRYGDENRGEDLIRDGILGRPIEPEQVADAVAFLSSRRAGILSGVMLNLGN